MGINRGVLSKATLPVVRLSFLRGCISGLQLLVAKPLISERLTGTVGRRVFINTGMHKGERWFFALFYRGLVDWSVGKRQLMAL
jgi:hypothetical protein